jgi:hypothetical protein
MLAGCGTRAPSPAPAPAPSARVPAPSPAHSPVPAAPWPDPASAAPAASVLPPPRASRTWEEFRRQAAQRLVDANPQRSHTGKPQEVLLAIPVLEVDLNADGTVRRITVLRPPRQALDTVQLAIDAVHRAAPFGDVSRLPRPWTYTEVFLFNDDRRFKPRTLD